MPDRSTYSSRTSMATPIGGLAHLFSDARPQDREDRGFFFGGGGHQPDRMTRLHLSRPAMGTRA